MKKYWILALVVLALVFTGCADGSLPQTNENEPATADATAEAIEQLADIAHADLVIAATPEMNRHGLMDALIPSLEKRSGLKLAFREVSAEDFVTLGKNREADIFFTEDFTLADAFLEEHISDASSPFYENDVVIVGTEELGYEFGEIRDALVASGNRVLVPDEAYLKKMAEKCNLDAEKPIAFETAQENSKGILGRVEKGTFVLTDRASFLRDGASTLLVLDDARFMNFGLAMVLPSDGTDAERMTKRDEILTLLLEKETEDVLRSIGDGVYRVLP